MTESYPNILEQELRSQVQQLTNEINENSLLAQQKMNELQDASNAIEEERLEAERQISDLNDQMYKMKYDEAIRHKYVYQQLINNKADADAKPRNHVPFLLPRRKNLDYIADIPNALDVNIPMKPNTTAIRPYYNTQVDPLYSTKPLGHDVFDTDIVKQKKELGTLDDKWRDQQLHADSRLFDFGAGHLNPSLYAKNSGYVDSLRLPDRFGGFQSGNHMLNYNTSNKGVEDEFDRLLNMNAVDKASYAYGTNLSQRERPGSGSRRNKPLTSASKFTYL